MNSLGKLLAAPLALLTLFFLNTALAKAACPVRETSIFGTVQDVDANVFTLQTNSRMGYIHVFTRSAHMHDNGLTLRSGVFAGVYGCLAPQDRSFRATEVTLASSAETYPRMHLNHGDTWVQGRIDVVAPGRVRIDSGSGHGDLWVQTAQQGLYSGQLIQAVGHFTPGDREFVSDRIVILTQ